MFESIRDKLLKDAWKEKDDGLYREGYYHGVLELYREGYYHGVLDMWNGVKHQIDGMASSESPKEAVRK